jgi:predicted transcriptional regulator
MKGAVSSEKFSEKLDFALRGMPSPEYIRLRLDAAFNALPTSDVVEERLTQALKRFPGEQEIRAKIDTLLEVIDIQKVNTHVDDLLKKYPTGVDVLGKIDEALAALPNADAMESKVDRRIRETLPPQEEIAQSLRESIRRRVELLVTQADINTAVQQLFPEPDVVLESIKSVLPERERFQEALSRSIAEAIENALPEKVWIESLSRGLFDEKAGRVLPKREEVAEMMRREIRDKMVEVMERLVRSEIERITSVIK